MPHFFFLSHSASTCVLYTFMFSHPILVSISHFLAFSLTLGLCPSILYHLSSCHCLSLRTFWLCLSLCLYHPHFNLLSVSLTHSSILSVCLSLSLSLSLHPYFFLIQFFSPSHSLSLSPSLFLFLSPYSFLSLVSLSLSIPLSLSKA